jgi:hypothetical protein
VQGSQYRLPVGAGSLPAEQDKPEWALAPPEVKISSSYYPDQGDSSVGSAESGTPQGVQSGNPLRDMAANPMGAALTTHGLYIDKVYSVSDIASRLVSAPGASPDPRIFAPTLGGRWLVGGGRPHSGHLGPPDYANEQSAIHEVIRVTFDDLEPFNSLDFQIANVPCNFEIWYLDPSAGRFVLLTDAKGEAIKGRVPGKKTTTISGVALGGWIGFSFDFPVTVTKEVELRIDRRIPAGDAPTLPNKSQGPLAYRIGTRNVAFHLDVCVRDDAPPNEIPYGIRTALGFVEQVTFHDYDAARTSDGDDSTYWMSGPNPFADSVVPLYVDVRDAEGEAQRIDRLRLKPMAPGPRMNLYSSSDDTTGPFRLSRALTTLAAHGNASVDAAGRYGALGRLGALNCPANGDYLDLTGAASGMRIDLDPSMPWVIGALYTPAYASNVSATDRRWIIDISKGTASYGVCYDPADDRFKLIRLSGGVETVLGSSPATFGAGDGLTVVAGYSPGNQAMAQGFYIAWAKDNTVFPAFTFAAGTYAGASFLPDTVTIGASAANHDGTHRAAKGHVSRLWVRQDFPSSRVAAAFHARPDEFIDGRGAFDRMNGTWRTLLQARLTSSLDARIGPGEGFYEAKVWTPINRDFVLKPGIVPLPPTTCKYLKLEFTDLVARPYPVIKGCTLIHRDYPAWVKAVQPQPTSGTGRTPRANLGTFSDFPGYPIRLGGVRGSSGLPQLRRQLENSGSGTGIQSPTITAARSDTGLLPDVPGRPVDRHYYRFLQAGLHEYDEQQVDLTQQEAYFVGLNDLRVYRIEYPT